VRLVADANVLLSAVIGGRARVLLDHPYVTEVLVAEATLTEVQEYAAQLAVKNRLSLDIVLLAVASLPVTLMERGPTRRAFPRPSAVSDAATLTTLTFSLWLFTLGCRSGLSTTISRMPASNGTPLRHYWRSWPHRDEAGQLTAET